MKKIYSILTLLTVFCVSLIAVSCSDFVNEDDQMAEGYLKLDVSTLVSTNDKDMRGTSAPADYAPKTIAVKISNAQGDVVFETSDAANDERLKSNILLAPGKYTISGSSAGWDGSGSGFDAPYYTGSTMVLVLSKTLSRATLTLTQANVKVSVTFDENLRPYFKSANCVVTSQIADIEPCNFAFSSTGGTTTTSAAYFPVAPLNFLMTATNNSDNTNEMSKQVTDVQARDHYRILYKLADVGSTGGITVTVDETTREYNFTISIPRKSSISLQSYTPNAWSDFADLSAAVLSKTQSFDNSKLTFQYRKQSETEWKTIMNGQLTTTGADAYSCRLTGLTPNTGYIYRLRYDDGSTTVNSNEMKFTTEEQTPLQNAGFENWYKSGKIWYPNAEGESYWSTSNSGSAGVMGENYNVTTGITDGAYNGTSAQLQSKYVVIKFAAASIFTGGFDGMIGTNGAKLSWGVPFTSRPAALKGYMKYNAGSINRGTQPSGAAEKGENDHCQIFCALLTEQLKVANADNSDGYELSTNIDWQNDPRVVAYGELTQNTTDAEWKAFNIPLTYHSTTIKPTHMLIVCSSSRWGDYFYGSDSSKLLLDDFSFTWGEPVVR